MSKFLTAVDPVKDIKTCSGTGIKQKFVAEMNEKGSYQLVEAGTEDIYSYIQSWKDSCDIDRIVARFEAGEVDVLSKMQGFSADISNLPDNMHEIFNLVNKGHAVFDSLPIEEKEKFNNSFEQWLINYDFRAPDAEITDPDPGNIVKEDKEDVKE